MRVDRLPIGAIYTAVMLAVIALPTALVIPMSFDEGPIVHFPPTGLSTEWYSSFFGDEDWTGPTLVSLWLGVSSASLALLLGALAAWPLSRIPFRGRGIVRAVLLCPLVVPPITLAVGAFLVWARLGLLGGPVPLVVTHVVIAAPFVIVVVGAAMRRIEVDQLRAAQSLGANPFTVVRRIIVPTIAPSLVAGWAFAFVNSIDEVVLTRYLLSPRQTSTLSVAMFNELSENLSPIVAVASTLLTVTATFVAVGAAVKVREDIT